MTLAGLRDPAQFMGGDFMTIGGWIFMVFSIGFVVSLVGFCFFRVLKKPVAANHMHAPLEIDTHDLNT